MQRVFYVVITILIIISCTMQNEIFENIIVYPKNSDWIVEYEIDGNINRMSLDLPIFSDYNFDNSFYKKDIEFKGRLFDHVAYSNTGWIACITNNGRSIKTYKLSHSNRKFITNLIALPKDYSALTISIQEDILFVGGKGKNEILGFYDLNNKPKWNLLSIPDELLHSGKAIDDLLIVNNDLIAIDNIVLPKWILKYNITNPAKPIIKDVKKLNTHGTYAEITKSSYSNDLYFILSNTSSMGGAVEHISLLDRNFKEIGYFSNVIKYRNRTDYLHDTNDTFYSWNSIEVVKDLLLISSDNKGLGILDLSKIDLTENGLKKAKEEIIYTKLSKNQNSKVLNVLTFPNYDKIVVIMSINGIFRTKELSINDIEKIIKDS